MNTSVSRKKFLFGSGRLDIVKAAVAAFPNLVSVPGPHGIPLLAHAENGGEQAKAVLEFLRPRAGKK